MKRRVAFVVLTAAVVALCGLAMACQARGFLDDGISSSSSSPEGNAESSEAANDVSSTSQDASAGGPGDSEEEWPGQSQGFVGPNGEGAISGADFESDEDYTAAIEAAQGGWEQPVELEFVDDAPAGVGPYARGMLNIGFYKSCSEYDAHAIVESLGGVWARDGYLYANELDWANAYVYFPECATYEELAALSARLEEMDEVKFVELETLETDDKEPPQLGASSVQQAYLYYSKFQHAWEVAECAHDVTIAVIDVDFDLDHPDLAGNILMGIDASTGAFLQSDRANGIGHGTAVAGVASAVSGNAQGIDGASSNAWLLLVARDDAAGNASASYTLSALQYLLGLGEKPDVVNMSFGSYTYHESYQDVISALHDDYGVVLVASAGNDSTGNDHYPSGYDGVVSVASIGIGGVKSDFSNTNSSIDLCAVGEGIYTTVNPHARIDSLYYSNMFQKQNATSGEWEYQPIQGTSFAAPQVAAAAALLKAQDGNRSAEDIEGLLFASASQPAGFIDEEGGGTDGDEPDGKDDQGRYGYGALDAAEAVGWTPAGGGSGTSPHTADDGDGGGGDAMAAYEAQLAAQEAMRDPTDREAADALERAVAANPDVFGWLSVDGTNVSLPLCRRAGDDAYYLTHGSAGEEAPFGAAYIEGANSPSLGDPLTVAYGHTCRGAAPVAFTELHYLGCRPLFDALGSVRVRLPGKVLEYRVAAASVVSDEHILGEVAAGGPAALQRCYDALCDPSSGCSLVRGGARPSARRDRVLMLSTCSGYGYEGRRFVVTCVLAGEREV